MPAILLAPNKDADLRQDIVHRCVRHLVEFAHLPDAPIEIADLVDEDGAGCLATVR